MLRNLNNSFCTVCDYKHANSVDWRQISRHLRDTAKEIVQISFSTVSLWLRHHNRWAGISCFPSPVTILVWSVVLLPAHSSDESSLRSEALYALRAPDHKPVCSRLSTSPSICRRWHHSVASAASPKGLRTGGDWWTNTTALIPLSPSTRAARAQPPESCHHRLVDNVTLLLSVVT